MPSGNSGDGGLHRRTVLQTMGAASAATATPAVGAETLSAGVTETDTRVRVLSSRPHQVTGGDALLEVELGEGVGEEDVTITVNEADISDAFSPHPVRDSLTGLVGTLAEGHNVVEVIVDEESVATKRLINHPDIGPIFSGPNQQPFACTVDEELGFPLIVDNDEGRGVPVEENGEVIGYSEHCMVEDEVDYVYRTTEGDIESLDPADGIPDDVGTAEVDGDTVNYIIRWERGTINRFIYSIAMLDPELTGGDEPGEYDPAEGWNEKVIYQFSGGAEIGHTQGEATGSRVDNQLKDSMLSQGYAVLWSSGNRTMHHYNLQVGGETALMVKEEFIQRYGEPLYTVALGGSGGAIQQYVYGQNHPDLLDGAIPARSYPDMVTQVIHVGDCELLEFFMDVIDDENEKWMDWENRSWLIGFNAENDIENSFTGEPGSTECVEGWRGLMPIHMNPHFHNDPEGIDRLDEAVVAETEWNHWDDLRQIYGVDEDGYARRAWDNVGVQYGLGALREGHLTKEEFLTLNEHVGGWKPTAEMEPEGAPFGGEDWDPWSSRNMIHSGEPEAPEPRVEGDMEAIRAIYRTGMVFRGEIDIPIIDWRQHMEEELDMHNTHQSFAARQRMIDWNGDAEGHVIWFTDSGSAVETLAVSVMDEWLENIRESPDAGLDDTRPERAVDACFDGDDWDDRIASGDGVWGGILNDEECGSCTEEYPTYTTSRIEAGEPITGEYFKCQLKPLEDALEDGTYGDIGFTEDEIARLEAVFPDGVCDYDQPPAGLPTAFKDYTAKRPPQVDDALVGPPTDLGVGDGLYRDITGDGELTIADVQTLFEHLHTDEVQAYAEFFNFSQTNPNRVTVFDVQALFTDLQNKAEILGN